MTERLEPSGLMLALLLFGMALALSPLACYVFLSVEYHQSPLVCEPREATVAGIRTTRHCNMGCRGFDHEVDVSGVREVRTLYYRTAEEVWPVADTGERISFQLCRHEGYVYELFNPSTKKLP